MIFAAQPIRKTSGILHVREHLRPKPFVQPPPIYPGADVMVLGREYEGDRIGYMGFLPIEIVQALVCRGEC